MTSDNNSADEDSSPPELDDDIGTIYKNKSVEVSIEDGVGKITVSPRREGDTVFVVPKEDVEAFSKDLASGSNFPSPPEGYDDEIDAPAPFETGKVRHTGGGIWVREYSHALPQGDGHIKIAYGVPEPDGVQVGVYDEELAWAGEVDSEPLDDHTEAAAIEMVETLIERYNNGDYDSIISSNLDR